MKIIILGTLDESRQSSNYEAHTSLSRDVCDGLLLGFPKGGKVTSGMCQVIVWKAL